MNIFNKLKDAGILSEQDQIELERAFEQSLNEAKLAATDKVRKEYATRMESEKVALAEALDKKLTEEISTVIATKQAEVVKLQEAAEKFNDARTQYESAFATLKEAQTAKFNATVKSLEDKVTAVLEAEMNEFAKDKQKLVEARQSFEKVVAEAQTVYSGKMREHMTKLRRFVIENLEVETKALTEQRRRLVSQKRNMFEQFKLLKNQEQMIIESKTRSLEKFVTESLAKELSEFALDKQALVEARIEFATTAKKKLKETQEAFLKNAAKTLSEKFDKVMSTELKTLHEDIETARQNNLGRKIYEALASEVKSNYMSDHTEVISLKSELTESQAKLDQMQKQLVEAKKAQDQAINKAKLVEEAARRDKKLTTLLSPLTGEKRRIMREMLATVKTDRLDEAFDKYIVSVIGTQKQAAKTEMLSESATKSVTTNKLTETGHTNDEAVSTEIDEVDADIKSLLSRSFHSTKK